ncbi:MAG: hypothetical protein IPL62_19265 [Caulobacteraceae bacterium]|nr:hypothetical protein [Caulobacteraceae bacterium]
MGARRFKAKPDDIAPGESLKGKSAQLLLLNALRHKRLPILKWRRSAIENLLNLLVALASPAADAACHLVQQL